MSEEDLPATTPRYRYEGIEQCLEIMDKELQRYGCEGDGNPYVVVFAVDERSFLQDFLNPRNNPIAKYLSAYNLNSATLLFKMPSFIHGAAQGTFADIFHAWRLKQTGYLMSFTGHVRGSSQGKAADIAWQPYDLPSHRNTKWPTVAVEVKWSEGRGKVRRDIKFWLEDSERDVKVALTISVQRRGRITVERWDLSPGGNPFPSQTMEIHRTAEGPLINGEINVEFRDVFLRDKEPAESDFTLTHDDMKHMARAVWYHLDQQYS